MHRFRRFSGNARLLFKNVLDSSCSIQAGAHIASKQGAADITYNDSVEFHSGDLVILTDDDGNEVRYEYLDQIEYSDKVYDILVPEDSENVEVYLENGNSDITLETNPKTAEAVFGLFKTKNADRFDFS